MLYFWCLNNRKISLSFKYTAATLSLLSLMFCLLSYLLQIPSFLQWNSICFFPLKRFKLTKHQKPQPLCFWQRFLSIIGIPIHIEYAWIFINHLEVVVTFFQKLPLVRDVALSISRKDDHSACIFHDFAVGQHFCVTHLLANCHRNAVRNRCARNLLEPLFNNKSECLTRWQVMYRFQ